MTQNSLSKNRLFLMLLGIPFLSGCVQVPAALIGLSGAGIELWVVILVLVATAILKPQVLPWLIGLGVLVYVAATTSFTIESFVWIGIIIFILWLLTKRK